MNNNEYELYRPGDLAFFRNRSSRSVTNCVAQSAKKKRIVKFSHIAMSDGQGGFIHADINAGVDRIYFDEILDDNLSGYAAFRHPVLDQSIREQGEEFIAALAYYLGQDYIRDFTDGKPLPGAQKFTKKDLEIGETFCSKLINDILKRFAPELALSQDKPFPGDFEQLVKKEDWVDVSSGHKTYFRHLKSTPEMKKHRVCSGYV